MQLEGIYIKDVYDNLCVIHVCLPQEIFAVGRSASGIFLKNQKGSIFAILADEDMLVIDGNFQLARKVFDVFPRMPEDRNELER
jgi:hypothetical protein